MVKCLSKGRKYLYQWRLVMCSFEESTVLIFISNIMGDLIFSI